MTTTTTPTRLRSRRTSLRGTRMSVDASEHSSVYVCELCARVHGPFTGPNARGEAERAALIHWDEWHREHRAGDGCTMPGCEAPHVAGGYCRKHYMRVRRTGDPNVRSTR